MSSANYLVRRAVVDDLPALIPLWQGMNYSPEELERRLTDFQVAVDGQGKLLGAVAFEAAGQQGRVHHEAFHDFSLAEHLRPLLWEKIQMLAQNNGVFRAWTQEDAPFWKQMGFQSAEREALQKLPAKWTAQGKWLTLPLKAEEAIKALSVDAEFVQYIKAEREKTTAQARVLKKVGLLLAILLALFVGALAIYAFLHDPALRERFQR